MYSLCDLETWCFIYDMIKIKWFLYKSEDSSIIIVIMILYTSFGGFSNFCSRDRIMVLEVT